MDHAKTNLCAAIVIPTYNEALNIGKLIDILCSNIFPTIIDWQMEIVIVDDSSPDGTRKIVESKSQIYKNVHLITRPRKSGIGSAYLDGFEYAIKELQADVVIEFDADFQHPPEIIPMLLGKITEGYDYVVGSRNIAGGSGSKNRNIFRSFLTSCGGLLARVILFFPGKYYYDVTDPTSGLKATRVFGFADKLNLDPNHLYSHSFGYKVQLLSEILRLGARYAEIPLNFQVRQAGESKISLFTIFDILFSCLRTRLNSLTV